MKTVLRNVCKRKVPSDMSKVYAEIKLNNMASMVKVNSTEAIEEQLLLMRIHRLTKL